MGKLVMNANHMMPPSLRCVSLTWNTRDKSGGAPEFEQGDMGTSRLDNLKMETGWTHIR